MYSVIDFTKYQTTFYILASLALCGVGFIIGFSFSIIMKKKYIKKAMENQSKKNLLNIQHISNSNYEHKNECEMEIQNV